MTLSQFLLSGSLRIRSGLALVLALAFLAVSAPPVFAAGGQNGNITGQVIDSSTGTPIANARVSFVAPTGKYQATTNAQGQFSILGAIVDTYTVSIQAQGYEPLSQPGVTVIGDQNLSLGQIRVAKQLRTIGRVTTRSVSSAFQPNQTVDSVTVNTGRIIQTTGKAASTDENALLLSVPGATQTSQGQITIRGGLANETGYQFDGIPYTEPFFATNASNNKFSGLNQVQVVEGAGDATQNNVGGGVVNLIPKRGTYPGTGLLDAEIGLPGPANQGQLEYGVASANGRVSDYISYIQTNTRQLYGYPGTPAAPYGNYFADARDVNSDLINNFVFKFGKNSNQSLQVLYQNRNLRGFGPYGGIATTGLNPTAYWQADPFQYAPIGLDGAVGGAANLASILPNLPGQVGAFQTPSEQEDLFNQTQFLKLEYDNQINSANYVDLKFYNTYSELGLNNLIGQTNQDPYYQIQGGRRNGLIADYIHQFTPNYTFTFSTNLENQHPIWDQFSPYNLAQLMTGNPGTTGGSSTDLVANPNTPGSGQAPSLADFLQPVNGACPVANGCYLSKYFTNGNIPKVPISGINYNSALFQIFGFAVRNQINIKDRVRLDLGARYDGAYYHFGPNPYNSNPLDLNNPSDVDPTLLSNNSINPRTIDPRAAVSYQMGRNDSLRFGYGRSTTFLDAQTAGTPAALYNANALRGVPAFDTAASPACGSNKNSQSTGGAPILFKCSGYAEQLYWLYDQTFDAPDLGGATAQVASNYDITYQHQFANGFGMRLTPFYKLSTGLPSFALISETTDPVTGAILTQTFTANNQGINRTTGVEFGLTSPEVRYGFDGFLSATYQNVLTSAPPLISGEESLPIISSGSLAIGNVYRAGYVSPFTARLGAEYKTKFGLRVAPVLQYDRGYPFNVGTTTASGALVLGKFQNIPSVNVGPGTTKIPGFENATGGGLATNFVDPANPGSSLKPNVAATRGTPDSPSAGGILFHPELAADLTVEYKVGRGTFGVQATNLFGNPYYGIVPLVNPYYQPVATGVAGPQSSQVKQANPTFQNGNYNNRGFANVPNNAFAYTNGAYLIPLATALSGTGSTPFSAPANITRFNFYYQLAL